MHDVGSVGVRVGTGRYDRQPRHLEAQPEVLSSIMHELPRNPFEFGWQVDSQDGWNRACVALQLAVQNRFYVWWHDAVVQCGAPRFERRPGRKWRCRHAVHELVDVVVERSARSLQPNCRTTGPRWRLAPNTFPLNQKARRDRLI